MDLIGKQKYDPHDFQHKKEKKLISEVMNHPAMESVMKWIKEQRMDEIYQYVYQSSCIRLTEKIAPKILKSLHDACDMFGAEEIPEIYLTRDYNQTIEIGGISVPFLLISSDYLQKLDGMEEDVLFGALASQVAGIKVGHHRGLMLSWTLQNGMKWFTLPAPLLFGFEALLNDWKRSRFYTCDRAFLLAVNDYPLTIRSLFMHMLPGEILDQFAFGTMEDKYLPQMEQFMKASNVDVMLKAANSARHDTAWLPLRYREIELFWKNMREKVEESAVRF